MFTRGCSRNDRERVVPHSDTKEGEKSRAGGEEWKNRTTRSVDTEVNAMNGPQTEDGDIKRSGVRRDDHETGVRRRPRVQRRTGG